MISFKNLLILLLFFMIIPCVCASENLDEITYQITHINDTSIFENNSDINKLFFIDNITINGKENVKSSNSTLELKTEDNDSIVLNKSSFKAKIFKLDDDKKVNLLLLNSNFKNELRKDGNLTDFYLSAPISKNVTKTAKEIAGNSTDIEAAKKLANWVGMNIEHETKAGFYQSPDDTLKRKTGNCCSQTELFLQMCEALNITHNHKTYIVHVGSERFHDRHFFAMIDNTFVDVDTQTDNPWGNAETRDDEFYCISEYPILPLPRQY